MTGNPDDDLRALRQMLEVPPDRDFPAGRRHVREEHLMTSWMSMNRKPQRLTRRIAVSVAVSTAAVGAFAAVAAHDSGPKAATNAVTTTGGAVTGDEISTVAYSLTKKPDDSVLITVHPDAAVVPAQIEADLARLGIHATASVLTPAQLNGQSAPKDSVWSMAQRQSNGDYTAEVRTGASAEQINFEGLKGIGTGNYLCILVTPAR